MHLPIENPLRSLILFLPCLTLIFFFDFLLWPKLQPNLEYEQGTKLNFEIETCFLRWIFCWQTYRVFFFQVMRRRSRITCSCICRATCQSAGCLFDAWPGQKTKGVFMILHATPAKNDPGPWRWFNWNRKVITSDQDMSLKTLLITKKTCC